ncbi:MAG: hypothetical protein IT294_08060 [Deltaproteobacteria bacterium]|nr:hypothetical protein [Deltaproteobacteria bacterium]
MTTMTTMPTTRILSIVALLAALVAAPAFAAGAAADADLDVLRDAIRANRKALVAASLTLTEAEATQFWPLYDRYEAELKGVTDRLVKVIQDYTSHYAELTDAKAGTLAADYLAIEEDRAKVRRTYFGDFSKVLPGKKAARFYQIENKMDAVIRYDLARTIPVVEE